MALKVLLVGQEAAGAQILRRLVGSSHQVVAVLTQEPKKPGESASLSGPAKRAGLMVLPAKLVKDPRFAAVLREWEVDVLLNVHSLHIISEEVLAAPTIGAFNLHPGPLPSYAGMNTPAWGIYNGETEYGVTVHWMHPGIDTGPVALDARFPMPTNATALTLATECTLRGVELLSALLERASAGAIPSRSQDLSQRTYYPRDRIPQNGHVDWDRPAEEVARFARAFDYGPFASPWGRPIARIAGRRVAVMGLEPTGVAADAPAGTERFENDSLLVACSDQWIRVGHVHVDGVPMRGDRFVECIRSTGSMSVTANI